MVGKKRKGRPEAVEVPLDLASRIGMPGSPEPVVTAPEPVQRVEPVRRVDGPIESLRGRPLMIGANEPPPVPIAPRRTETPQPPSDRPALIGLEEPPARPVQPAASPEPAPEAQVMEYAHLPPPFVRRRPRARWTSS